VTDLLAPDDGRVDPNFRPVPIHNDCQPGEAFLGHCLWKKPACGSMGGRGLGFWDLPKDYLESIQGKIKTILRDKKIYDNTAKKPIKLVFPDKTGI